MNTEFETKVLDINVQQIINLLRELKAEEFPETLMRRYVFDHDSIDVEFIRLREYGDTTTLTYKHKKVNAQTIGETQEIEVTVSNFDKTAEILKKLPFKRIFYQENKRHRFVLDEIEFAIDTWPMLPPLLEVEAKSKEELRRGIEILNLIGKDSGDMDMKQVYKRNGIDLHSFQELTFSSK